MGISCLVRKMEHYCIFIEAPFCMSPIFCSLSWLKNIPCKTFWLSQKQDCPTKQLPPRIRTRDHTFDFLPTDRSDHQALLLGSRHLRRRVLHRLLRLLGFLLLRLEGQHGRLPGLHPGRREHHGHEHRKVQLRQPQERG